MSSHFIWVLSLLGMLGLGISPVMSQAPEPVEIGLLLPEMNASTSTILDQLKDEIVAVVGRDANITFPDSLVFQSKTLEQAENNYRRMIDSPADILLAFGPLNNIVITRQELHVKPTVLFGAIPADFAELDMEKEVSGIDNLVYLINPHSIDEDLKTLESLYAYDNVGIAISQTLVDNLPVRRLLEDLFRDKLAAFQILAFEEPAELNGQLDGIDALYVVGGYLFAPAETKALAQALIDRRIPSFTATTRADVELGLMASNQPAAGRGQFVRRIALTVEAIVNGQNPSTLPLYLEREPSLMINFNTADRLGIPLRYSLVATTRFVGNFENVNAEKVYNLKEVMEEAVGRNLSLQSRQKDVELAGQDVRTAKSSYLPEVTASATGSYVDPELAKVSNGQNPELSTSGNLAVSQLVYAPGASANIKIQKELVQAERENYNTETLDLILDASTAYVNALLLKANAQVNKRNLELTEENLTIARQQFESGQSGKSDVLRFQSQLAQNTQQFVESLNQMQQAILVLNQVLNHPVGRNIDVEDISIGAGIYAEYDYEGIREILDNPILLEPFIEFLVQEALNNSPELKSLAFSQQANTYNLNLNTQGRFLPTLAFQGQVNSTFSRSGEGTEFPAGFPAIPLSYYTMGMNLSLPIFQQNQRNINRQSALIQRDQIQINQENFELNITRNVSSAVLDLVNQISNLETSKVFEATARESLELTQESYIQGAVNRVQLIDAQNNYFQAQQTRNTAVYNFLLSSLQLERSIGFFFLLNSPDENESFRERFTNYLLNR